jgi:hypothetical protein
MISHGAVRGIPNLSINNLPCQTCIQGKQGCKSIPKSRTTQTTEVLQLVHFDIAGPFRVRSLGGLRTF